MKPLYIFTQLKNKDIFKNRSNVASSIRCKNSEQKIFVNLLKLKNQELAYTKVIAIQKRRYTFAEHVLYTQHKINFTNPQIILDENNPDKRFFLENLRLKIN